MKNFIEKILQKNYLLNKKRGDAMYIKSDVYERYTTQTNVLETVIMQWESIIFIICKDGIQTDYNVFSPQFFNTHIWCLEYILN